MSLEQIILVDDQNRQIGVAEKLSSHHANTPLHRAFSCYVFNDKISYLLQKEQIVRKYGLAFGQIPFVVILCLTSQLRTQLCVVLNLNWG